MALAVLLDPHSGYVENFLGNEQHDLGSRLSLCRGVANSCSENVGTLVTRSVWPFLRRICALNFSKQSTSNRHFALAALEAVARCEPLRACVDCYDHSEERMHDELYFPLTELVAVNYDSPVHSQLESGMRGCCALIRAEGARRKVVAMLWNDGVSPLLGPLEQVLRVWGPSVLRMVDCSDLAQRLLVSCGDVRVRSAAVRMFEAFVKSGATDWEPHLLAALSKVSDVRVRVLSLSAQCARSALFCLQENPALRLVAVELVIPAAIRTGEEAVKRLCEYVNRDDDKQHPRAFERSIMRFVLVARCPAVAPMVLPSRDALQAALLSYSGWLRRYALEAAVAMQDRQSIALYVQWFAKEHSQHHRTAVSGALCRWWKSKPGAVDVHEVERRISWNLYCGAPHSRQAAVSMWLSAKKSFASATTKAVGGSDLQTMLIEMMCSRYDANRLIAFELLRQHFRGVGPFADPVERPRLLDVATSFVRCIRVRVADGGARLFAVLFSAEQHREALDAACDMLARHLEVGTKDFARAASTFTLHGPLMVLKYLLDEPGMGNSMESAQVARLVRLCCDVIDICRPYVCNEQLEGMSENVKLRTVFEAGDSGDEGDEEHDEEEDDGTAYGSHIRVCAWRGVREACLVLGMCSCLVCCVTVLIGVCHHSLFRRDAAQAHGVHVA